MVKPSVEADVRNLLSPVLHICGVKDNRDDPAIEFTITDDYIVECADNALKYLKQVEDIINRVKDEHNSKYY